MVAIGAALMRGLAVVLGFIGFLLAADWLVTLLTGPAMR